MACEGANFKFMSSNLSVQKTNLCLLSRGFLLAQACGFLLHPTYFRFADNTEKTLRTCLHSVKESDNSLMGKVQLISLTVQDDSSQVLM